MTVIPHPGEESTLVDGKAAPTTAVTVSPFYYSSVNEITQPNSYTACSHYLTRRWKRELGPNGYAILTSFRDRCFFNRKTGELRDVIQIPIPEIAEECGISEKTVRREMAGNKALQRFVRAQREPAPDARRGGWRWGPNTFQVAMDDPLHPDDEQELIAIVQRKADEAEKTPEEALARARRLAASGQNDRTQKGHAERRSDRLTERKDNLSEHLDKLSTTSGQIDRTLKSPDSSILLETLFTPAAPEDSLSLFSDQKLKAGWNTLTEQQQQPYLDRAEQELIELCTLTGWGEFGDRAKQRQKAGRARTLYEADQKVSTA